MKHTILLLFFSATVFSQKIVESFSSTKLGETREITIGLPPAYEQNSKKQYPIIVLLDGDYLFDPFFGVLSYGAYWNDFPECIIVGISQNKKEERNADSTHDELNNLPSQQGARFFEFIGMELLPYIEKKYRIAPLRIIAGHEKTAGFLNFFLYKDNPLFNAYLSLSPELPLKMETRIPENLEKQKEPLFYYLSSCGGDLKDVKISIHALDNNIKLLNNPKLKYKFDEFNDATHYSAVLYAIPNAFYHFFDYYKPISKIEFVEKIAILPNGYVNYLTDKYNKISKTLGYSFPVRTNDFKAIEAAILKNKAYQELEDLSQIARENYPKTMLADYELGLMYEKNGDVKRAAKAYQKASQLEEIGNLTKDMMLGKFDELQSLIQKNR